MDESPVVKIGVAGVRLCLVGAHFPISQVAAALEVGCAHGLRWEDLRSWRLVEWMKEYLKLWYIIDLYKECKMSTYIFIEIYIFYTYMYPYNYIFGWMMTWQNPMTYLWVDFSLGRRNWHIIPFTSRYQLMVDLFFGARWFGFLGYP